MIELLLLIKFYIKLNAVTVSKYFFFFKLEKSLANLNFLFKITFYIKQQIYI